MIPGVTRFARYVARPDREIRLAEAALLFAAERFPGLDVERYLQWLDAQGYRARERFDTSSTQAIVLDGMRQLLFDELGFHGNAENYYDERNSHLNEVIDRRTGIPITLSLVYLEIGRRAGLRMDGVGLPGHFIVRVHGLDWTSLVDPFNRGIPLSDDDCAELMSQVAGRPIPLVPDVLQPISNRAFLARLLTNLQAIYLQAEQWERGIQVIDAVLGLQATGRPTADLLRTRGSIYYKLAQWENAERDWLEYLALTPGASDAAAIRYNIDAMRTNLSRRN